MTKKITYLSLLTAIAIILGYIETMIPFSFSIPGSKIGLANIICIITLYYYGFKETLIVSLLRCLIIAITFTNLYMFLYSISGAILSIFVMYLLKQTKSFSILIISITGAICHNLGQLIIAIIFLGFNIIYYLPYLLIIACVTGTFMGLIALSLIRKLPLQIKN
ncbi:Gx transporter family protein [Thomasclavelia sp.]